MFGMSRPKPADGSQPRRAPARPAARVNVTVKLSAAQRDKLQRLGGAPCLRQLIDAADEPPA